MFNPFSRETTVAGYVKTLSRWLCWTLPSEKAEAIVAETESHLAERVDDLMATGADQATAEATAVAGFGSAYAYSRALGRSAFDDRFSRRARQCAAVVGTLLLGILLCLFQDWLVVPRFLQTYVGISDMSLGGALYRVGLAIMLLFAFWGKRPQTGLFAAVVLAGTLGAFVNGGVNYIHDPNSKWPNEVARWEVAAHRDDPIYAANMKNDIRLLQSGCQVFSSTPPQVPASLLYHGQIIIPNDGTPGGGWTDDLALRTYPAQAQLEQLPDYRHDPNDIALHRLCEATPYLVARDTAEAAKAWRSRGKQWLSARVADQSRQMDLQQHWSHIQANVPQGFCLREAHDHGVFFASFGFALTLLEAFAALCGRFTYRVRKNRHRRLYA